MWSSLFEKRWDFIDRFEEMRPLQCKRKIPEHNQTSSIKSENNSVIMEGVWQQNVIQIQRINHEKETTSKRIITPETWAREQRRQQCQFATAKDRQSCWRKKCREHCVKNISKQFYRRPVTKPQWAYFSLMHYCRHTEAVKWCSIHKGVRHASLRRLCCGIGDIYRSLEYLKEFQCISYVTVHFIYFYLLYYPTVFIIHFIYYSNIYSACVLYLTFVLYCDVFLNKSLDDDWGAWSYVHLLSVVAQCCNFQNHGTNHLHQPHSELTCTW